MLSQRELKSFVAYDEDSGEFIRLKTTSSNAVKGEVAGYKDVKGYIRIRIKGKQYFAHSLAWLYAYGYFPKGEIDHIDHKRNNNSLSNLRDVTNQENQKNASLRKDNSSGVTGVNPDNGKGLWVAQIKVNKKKVVLGYFTDKFEAICARMSANNKYGFHENHGRTS
jgi:hypothetical protein